MAKDNLVALVYPHQKRLPVMIGDMNQAERNGILASTHGIPGHHRSGGILRPDGECAHRRTGRDRIPWPAVQRAAVAEDCLQLRAGDARPQAAAVYAAAEQVGEQSGIGSTTNTLTSRPIPKRKNCWRKPTSFTGSSKPGSVRLTRTSNEGNRK